MFNGWGNHATMRVSHRRRKSWAIISPKIKFFGSLQDQLLPAVKK